MGREDTLTRELRQYETHSTSSTSERSKSDEAADKEHALALQRQKEQRARLSRDQNSRERRALQRATLVQLVVCAFFCLALTYVCTELFKIPLNKQMWSISFLLSSAGSTFLFLALIYAVMDMEFGASSETSSSDAAATSSSAASASASSSSKSLHERVTRSRAFELCVRGPLVSLGQNTILIWTLTYYNKIDLNAKLKIYIFSTF